MRSPSKPLTRLTVAPDPRDRTVVTSILPVQPPMTRPLPAQLPPSPPAAPAARRRRRPQPCHARRTEGGRDDPLAEVQRSLSSLFGGRPAPAAGRDETAGAPVAGMGAMGEVLALTWLPSRRAA